MYCPTCGSEERQLSQYCRACGTDLRAVRVTLERPDAITESAVSARDHIGRAIADKIRMTESASELQKVAEEVLPEIEKFLESPADRRLRRLRAGIIMAFIGLGATFGGLIASMVEEDLFVLVIPGMILLFIGLAVIINGLLFTLPRKRVMDHADEALAQKALDLGFNAATGLVAEAPPNALNSGERTLASVTEHTTHQLKTSR
ncbi:MAG: zinc ribbon domain-containing protein [Pyrinomonadaceae bacterium]|nr:zinc ribbon domain-containing protein [Pyrinomonadaceae bacterium]